MICNPSLMLSSCSIAMVVPLLNEQAMLAERLSQFLALPVDELLLVDGGSSDGSIELLAESGAHWCTSEPGRALQMNAGAKLCESDILLFVHMDTVITSGVIEAVRDACVDPGVVGGRLDLRLDAEGLPYRLVGVMINLRSRLTGICTGDQCLFVRRDIFGRLGGFPEQPLMEDVEFSRRLKRQGRIACLRQCVVTSARRWQQGGVLRTILLMWYLRLAYWLGVSPERLARIYREVR